MKNIIRFRWLILVFWLAAAILLALFQPNLDSVIKEKGQGEVGEKYPSRVAEKLLNGINNSEGSTGLIVFNNEKKLSDNDMKEIQKGINELKASKDELGIIDIVNQFDEPEAEDQLASKDGTTVIASVTYEKKGRDVDTIKEELESKLKDVPVDYYLTGGDFINNDFIKATFAGVDKSAIITVAFILAVLILVFRSIVTPIVSLLSVGISYFCSMGIVGQLVDKLGFPVTSLTQMFIILILFGIGTDYNILLFNRFKEELAFSSTVDDAIVATYRTAGKTIMYSGLTVFIAFASLSFAEFGVYRSGNAVAIGILIFFIQLMTLTPLFMKLLGEKLFWPSHNTKGHKESKLWEKVTSASVRHPVITVALIFAVMIPVIYFSNQKLSYDSLKEMGPSYASVKGFNTVAEHFSKGKTMPATVVLKNDRAMDDSESLAVVDKLTEEIKAVEGVKEISGPTQPKGLPIDEFYTGGQTKTVVDGLTAANGGITQIYDGLKQANDQLSTSDFSKVGEMASGTDKLRSGLISITGGLDQIQKGLDKGHGGAQTLSSGVTAIENSMGEMNKGIKQLLDGYTQFQSGYAEMGNNYKNIAQLLLSTKESMARIQVLVGNIGESYGDSNKDPSYIELKQTVDTLMGYLSAITPEGIKQLNSQYDFVGGKFAEANKGLRAINDGLGQMEAGMAGLQDGLEKSSDGLKAIVINMGAITDGMAAMKAGQDELTAGLSGFSAFGSRLGEVTSGLKSISEGLDKTNSFLTQMSGAKTFFIPEEALGNADFKKSLDAYMSADRKTVKLIVTLEADPYSQEAIETVREINNIIPGQIKGTRLDNAVFGTAGETSRTSDLDDIATSDIAKTQVIVLIVVFLVLLLVIRSFWIPVYIIASLMAAYYTSTFVTGFLTENILKVDGVAWNVPFFSFVMIVALGVDYSIFLMMRYKEYDDLSPVKAIVKAAKNIGGVVVSAAIILAGTFLTLYPSGIQTLMQLAVSVSTGLLMLSLILLPIAMPAMISLPDKLAAKKSKMAADETE